MQKRLLLEWLKNQSVYPEVLPIVEVGQFFESPADQAGSLLTLLAGANSNTLNQIALVPDDEVWMLTHASFTATVPAGNTRIVGSISVTKPSLPGAEFCVVEPREISGIAGVAVSACHGRPLEHNLYLEGGSFVFLRYANLGAAASSVNASVRYIPVGKNQRS